MCCSLVADAVEPLHRLASPERNHSESAKTLQETQRLLPISNRRFGWWLSLSVGMMMFAGVLGASIVLRSGVPANEWPEHSWVKSHWCIGMVTIVLLLSVCWFLWREQKNRKGSAEETIDQPNRFPWVAFALAFALFSICVIGLDFQNKIELGLFPNRTKPTVYGEPDLRYLSGVSAVANERIASLEQLSTSDSRVNQNLSQWKLIRSGLIEWTRQKVGRAENPIMKTLSLEQLADQIYRTKPDSRLEKFALDETAELNRELNVAQTKIMELKSREILDAVAIASLQQTIDLNQQRLQYLDAFADDENSIHDVMHTALPKVIPSGPTWIANYWLLTGFLAVQLVIGTCLLVVLFLSSRRPATAACLDTLQNVTAFWYFVAGTGIMVSALVWIA